MAHPCSGRSGASIPSASPVKTAPSPANGREEQVVPMTPIRRRIAERLVEAQKSAALLTTFNEIDMSAVIALRKQHQDAFRRNTASSLASCRSS